MARKSGGNPEFGDLDRFDQRERPRKRPFSSSGGGIAARLQVYSGWNEVAAGTSEARSSAPIGIMPFSVR